MAIRDLVPRLNRGRETALVRHGEGDSLRDFQRQMNRLFEDFFTEFPLMPRWGEREFGVAGFSPRVDVSETDRHVKISAELPGLDEKDITVEMDETTLTIRGERSEEKEDRGGNWYCREQAFGCFNRVIPLPTSVDSDRAEATFKKGVLTISVPKREPDRTHRKTINIESD